MNDREQASYEPYEGEATLDPIRYAAVVGAPLIVLSEGKLFAPVREALAVRGRAGELREVWLCYCRRPVLDTASRRIDPAAVLPTEGWDARRAASMSESFSTAVRDSETYVDFLPPLDLEEAVSGACSVSIASGDSSAGCFLALWLFVEGTKRARREGTPPPILVYDQARDRAGHGMLGIVRDHDGAILPITDPRATVEAVRCRSAEEPNWDRQVEVRREWERLLVRYEAGARIRHGSDVCWLRHDGGIVAMGRECDGSGPPYVWEISKDGRCRTMVGRHGTRTPGTRVLRTVRRGGVAALAGIGWEYPDPRAARGSLERLAGYEGASIGDAERPSREADAAFEAAVAGNPVYESIAYLVRSDPAKERGRRDFVVTWPAFAHHLLDPDIRARVDAGERTTPVVARAAEIAPAVARRLVGLRDIPYVKCLAATGFDAGALFMGALGHDNVPMAGDAGEWEGLAFLCERINGYAHPHGVEVPVARALLLDTPGRGWAERWAGVCGDPDGRGDASDMFEGFATWLGHLRGETRYRGSVALRIMLGHGSLARVEAASRRWHADEALRDGASGLPMDLSWPVPFDPVPLPGGLRAVVLGGVRALVEEGGQGCDRDGVRRLDHCVGGYGQRCQTGESLVVSVRRDGPHAERLSTAELVRDPKGAWRLGGRAYALRQHRGRSNGEPPREARMALGGLFDLLRDGGIAVRAEALEPRAKADVDPDPSAAASLHPAWRRILPPAYAALGLGELLAKVDELDPPTDRRTGCRRIA